MQAKLRSEKKDLAEERRRWDNQMIGMVFSDHQD